jgi:hypothetical protein
VLYCAAFLASNVASFCDFALLMFHTHLSFVLSQDQQGTPSPMMELWFLYRVQAPAYMFQEVHWLIQIWKGLHLQDLWCSFGRIQMAD